LLRLWFCLLWLALLLGTTAILAIGGRPDPAGGTQPLGGVWRFHAGDDAGWADPGVDDRTWDRVTLVARPNSHDGDVGLPGYFDGWRAHGHPQLSGYGWYRRLVRVPPGGEMALVGPPAVDDGYEMFWNGRRLGGIGNLSGTPRVSITRPLIAGLPISAGGHTGLLAIRAFMEPSTGRDGKSGGLRTLPVLASRAQGEALYRAQWRRTIAGYVVDAVEPVAMLVLAIMALWESRALARPVSARWLALGLVAAACLRLGNAITAWTDLYDLPPLLQSPLIVAPFAKLAWTLGWNRWTDGPDRRWVSRAAVAAWMMLVAGALADSSLLAGAGRALIALSLGAIATRVVRCGDHRWLVLAAMLLVATGLFAADLSALGVPGIWFPFNIGVSRSQYAWALALPLVAWALAARKERD
jgi:hypothetical protein